MRHAVEQLPEDVAPALRQQAEKQLVHDAGDHDAKALRMLGRRVFEVVDPEAADLEEGRRLEREERTAARATYLHLCDNGDGTYTGRFKISTLHAAMLRKALHALTAPAHVKSARTKSAPPIDEQRLTRPEQLGHAFCDLLERFPANRLPKAGGASATVLVLLDYEKLLSGLWAAHLDTGEAISAGEARRLACSSDIIPVVYRRAVDGRSVVLDMGRRRRLHSELQRIGLDVQDRGCTAVGCDRPAAWCHAHHVVPWAEGGGTSVEMGRLLCGFHHHRAHSERYHTIPRADGKLLFHRRT